MPFQTEMIKVELYAEIRAGVGMITVVTYDKSGQRVERKIYIEEQPEGHVHLIVKGENLPKRLMDTVFWR